MILTPGQTFMIIGMVTLGTMITRFLPFILFKAHQAENSYISYLGEVLPYAAIGLLVVYCLKNLTFKGPAYGIPEIVAILFIIVMHYWRGNTLVSIGAGTLIYMVLVQVVFTE